MDLFPIMTKVCSDCKKELPKTEFHKNRRCKDGLNRRCKVCHHQSNLRVMRKYPERYNKKKRDYGRKYLISGVRGKILNKRDYPPANRCELCKRKNMLLGYHHWDNGDFSQGIWICRNCHIAVHWLENFPSTLYFDLKHKRINQSKTLNKE